MGSRGGQILTQSELHAPIFYHTTRTVGYSGRLNIQSSQPCHIPSKSSRLPRTHSEDDSRIGANLEALDNEGCR